MRRNWLKALMVILVLAGSVYAVDTLIRDDDGDTAYQGTGVTGEGAPIKGVADAYGRMWVNSGVTATHDSAALGTGVQILAAYDSTKPTAVADADAVRVLADSYGRLLAGWEPEKWQGTVTSADASSTEAVVKAGTASKKIACLFLLVSSDTSLTVTVEDEDDNALATLYVAARSGAVLRFPPEAPLVIGTADKNLQIQTSGAGNVTATATGYLYP